MAETKSVGWTFKLLIAAVLYAGFALIVMAIESFYDAEFFNEFGVALLTAPLAFAWNWDKTLEGIRKHRESHNQQPIK